MPFAVYMTYKSSSVNSINLVKKICYNSGDIDFFLGDCFLLAHPVYTHVRKYNTIKAKYRGKCVKQKQRRSQQGTLLK